MSCYHPIEGYYSIGRNANGKHYFTCKPDEINPLRPLVIACGRCIGCRLSRSRSWALRCCHESTNHFYNSFITLTYSDDYLPQDGTLVKQDFQLFMKRFRKAVEPIKLRYFHCGEYGTDSMRPHYHACIFGYDFPDRELFSVYRGNPLYVSPQLAELWPYGIHSVGALTFQSAAYTARYILKKRLGRDCASYYDDRGIIPEYITMSRRPGIGGDWIDKYMGDVYPHDYVVFNGVKHKPPRYYDTRYQLYYPSDFDKLKGTRRELAVKHKVSVERLEVMEEIQYIKANRLKRPL